MKKRLATRQLGRDRQARTALFRGLMRSLVIEEQITTTSAKARAVRPIFEKLLTRAREGNLAASRTLHAELQDKTLVKKLVHDIAPRFKGVNGGYTRLIQVGTRKGDAARLVRLSLTKSAPPAPAKAAKDSKSKKPAAKPAAKPTTPAAHADSAKPTHLAPKQVSRAGKRGDR